MTYQEQYEELFAAYDKATKDLNEATQKIAYTNGFGDVGDLGNYFKANRAYKLAEREFQKLLHYVTTANLNPNAEYIPQEYMYNVIKKDQQKKGTPWNEEDPAPSTKNGIRGYECLIGLTNDGEINKMIQGTEYKFQVLNLEHGKECYNYLAKMLQSEEGDGFDAIKLKFAHIDQAKQIFIKVVITIWQ
jgi:hypothetical protein